METKTLMVPLRVDTEIIAEGKTTTMPTIIMGAAVEFSMMQTVGRSFNAEHVICGVTLPGIVQWQTHRNYYADGADPTTMKMPRTPKSGVNLITMGTDEEEVLAITRRQSKLYLDSIEEKRKLEEARAKIEKATQAETSQLKDTIDTSTRNCAEQNIIK